MSGAPAEEPAAPAGRTAESVVLQYLEPGQAPTPTLTSTDLSAREIADSLWLAAALARPHRPDSDDPGAAAPHTGPAQSAPPDTGGGNEAAPPTRPRADPASDPTERQTREDWGLGGRRVVRPTTVDPGGPEVKAPLVWPTAPALPNPLVIGRALRPLAITRDSPWVRTLNEEATAVALAETKLWLPQWRAQPYHPYDVALVLDTSLSMEIWQHVVREFRDVLLRQGAFRDVRTYRLDCSMPAAEKLVLRTEAGAARGWRDLLDPTHRRVVLVVTDTVGAAWHNGAAGALLAAWGGSMPVAVVQTMPERLWHWGGLAPRRMRLVAAEPSVPNRRLCVEPAEPALGPRPRSGDPADVVVPVLALDAASLNNWARLFAAASAVNLTAVFVNPRGEVDADATMEPPQPDTGRERVRRFRTFASVEAFHLAGLLAVAPVSLATIDLVQRVLLPGAGVDTQAEVLLGGLMQRSPAGSAGFSFDFCDGVRDELLHGLFRSDVVRVARLVDDHLGERFPVLRNFRSVLADPHGAALPEVTAADRPFIHLQATVLRALSGPYTRRAKLLDQRLSAERESIQEGSGDTQPTPEGITVGTGVHPSPPSATADVVAGGNNLAVPTVPDYTRPFDINRSRVHQPRIWGDVMPLRNPDFVGREELLERLRLRLAKPGATAVLPEALHGLGGVGKSQTVAEYIYRHAGEYEVVWWISAEHPTQIRNSFVELASRLGIATV
ncbi:MAG TPA: SAV_2336 N-terminal domain-related protein, partial [Pseudonocardiaceae bacterium]